MNLSSICYLNEDGTYLVEQPLKEPVQVVMAEPTVVGVIVSVHSPPFAPVFADVYEILLLEKPTLADEI